eukprot:TCONS_00015514-protein
MLVYDTMIWMTRICFVASFLRVSSSCLTTNEIPPNNHGIQPQIYIEGPIKPRKGALITTIDRLSTEWSLSLDFKLLKAPIEYWTSIAHLSINDNIGTFGDRTPLVHLKYNTGNITLVVCTHIDDDDNHVFTWEKPLTIGKIYNVDIRQRYLSGGKYRFIVLVNGFEVHSKVNKKARQFYDVKFFFSSPWYEASDVEVYNLKHTNFL